MAIEFPPPYIPSLGGSSTAGQSQWSAIQEMQKMGSDYAQGMTKMSMDATQTIMPMIAQQASIANQNNILSSAGQLAMAQMQQDQLMAHMGIQLSSLAQKQAYTLMMDVTEQFLYTEMVREKLFNLYSDLEKSRFDNAFQRSKTIVQSMKY